MAAARRERGSGARAALAVGLLAGLATTLGACTSATPMASAIRNDGPVRGIVVPGPHMGVSESGGAEAYRRDARLGVRGEVEVGGVERTVTLTYDQRRTTNGRVRETSRTTTRSVRTTNSAR